MWYCVYLLLHPMPLPFANWRTQEASNWWYFQGGFAYTRTQPQTPTQNKRGMLNKNYCYYFLLVHKLNPLFVLGFRSKFTSFGKDRSFVWLWWNSLFLLVGFQNFLPCICICPTKFSRGEKGRRRRRRRRRRRSQLCFFPESRLENTGWEQELGWLIFFLFIYFFFAEGFSRRRVFILSFFLSVWVDLVSKR